ncbi:RHS repeat domain-containing protein [Porphyromonas gingivalis]|uniref:RHS repeat domain-containing protein n=1 Tax=Porphyromonas gingivalis TaxID=837 RepID=UPI000974FA64|nr:RHS repeat-associated core domain-containing protein [Porphyromonas gingivalis]SJL20503.1 tRNA(Glu)-specific nuclease WapA [Porphyromonas gingivalis]
MKKLYASLLSLSSFFLCSPLTSKADILSLEVLDSLSQRQKATSIRELREAQAAADAAAATISGLDNLPIYMDVDPGEISYQSGVSRSGAKTYSVPIFTAPSVGAKPTIALSYNSQSIQEGVAGVGWNIVGASAINLVNRTLYFDNDICAVDFSNPNTYALSLDGDRAISGTTLMGKVRITPKYNNDNVLISFDALMPDGGRATFGLPDNTTPQASYPILSYTDALGYRVDYSYRLSGNVYFLTKVAYGGRTADSHFNHIDFEYEGRQNCTVHYISGQPYESNMRLKSIHSYGQGKLLRKYTLLYKASHNKSQLQKISCETGKRSLSPLSFVYGFDSSQEDKIYKTGEVVPLFDTGAGDKITSRGRFFKGSDRDGFICFSNRIFDQWQAQDNNSIFVIPSEDFAYAPISLKVKKYTRSIQVADINGDGVDEIICISVDSKKDKANKGLYDAQKTYCWIYYFDGIRFNKEETTYSTYPKSYYTNISFLLGDATGDGAIDAIAIIPEKGKGGKNNGDQILFDLTLLNFKQKKAFISNHLYGYNIDKGLFFRDITGDEKAELVCSTISGYNTFKWIEKVKDFSSDKINIKLFSTKLDEEDDSFITNSKKFLIADINGDGKPDQLISPTASYYTIFPHPGHPHSGLYPYEGEGAFLLDKGKQWKIEFFDGEKIVTKQIEVVRNMLLSSFYLMDINKDGLPDLVEKVRRKDLAPTPYDHIHSQKNYLIRIFFNRNGEFSPSDFILSEDFSDNSTNDFDLIQSNNFSPRRNCPIIGLKSNIGYYFEVSCDEQTRHLITGVQSSTGLIETNEYAAPKSGYTFPPLPDGYNYLSFPLKTVSKVSKGIKGEPHRELTEYTFTDGVINRHGLGFCGFKETKTYTSWDYAFGDGVETVTQYDPLQQGVPLSSTTRIGFNSSDKIKASSFIYQSNGQTGPWKKPLLISSQESDLLNNTTLSRTYTYDSEDFPVKTTEDNGEGVQTITEQTYRHIKQSNSYRLGLPLTKTTTHKRNGNQWMQKESIAYNAALLPISIISFTGENGTLKTGEIRREYDDAGNMTTETSAPYDATDFRGKTFTYDDKGRLASETDIFGQKTVYEEYDAYGHPCLIRDDRGNEIRSVYDAWGNIASIRNADGSKEEYSRQLLTNGYPRNLQVITSTNDGGKTLAEYDAYGREVKTGMLRFDGSWLYTAKEYTAAGMLKRESLPFKGNTPLHWNTCEYDRYKRPVKQTMPSGAVQTWAYTPRRVSETKEAITTTRVSDASGLLESVSDPGGEITYHYRPDGQPSEIKAPGNVKTLFEYDQYGRQRAIIDPSAGRIETTETWTGRRRTTVRKDARKKVITSMYDEFGRLQKTVTPEFTTNYTYDKDLVKSAITTSGYSRTYDYDHLDRLIRTEETVEGKNLIEQLSYNTLGQLQGKTATLPTGATVTETYQYTRGTLTRKTLQDGSLIWQLLKENAMGLPTKVRTGSRTREYKYSTVGLPTERFTTGVGGFNYDFDPQTGNLLMRSDKNSGRYENFSYDGLNRLTGVAQHRLNGDLGIATLTSFSYTPNGNVTEISNIGKFIYSTQSPYRIVNMGLKMGAEAFADSTGQNISYASFDRPLTISGNGYTATLTYTDDYSRTTMTIRSPMLKDPFFKRTYIGNYEADSYGTQRKNIERYYIGGDAYSAPAVYVRVNSGQWKLHYIYRDYQGSVTDITDASGTVVHRMRYSPWGKLLHTDGTPYTRSEELSTDYDRLLFLGRGYTGHEYLPWFGLVNMNARLYDPAIGRFLSPDPYVQMPDFSQNLNRYSYCLNNPLKFTDPNGELFGIDDLIAAIVGGTINVVVNIVEGNVTSFAHGAALFAAGAASGVLTIYIGPAGSAAVLGATNSVINQGFSKGWNNISVEETLSASAMSALTSFLGGYLGNALSKPIGSLTSNIASPMLRGAISEGAMGALSGFFLGTGMSLMQGESLENSLKAGGNGFLMGAGIGAMTGTISGIKYARDNKISPWTGEKAHNHHSFPKFLGGELDQKLTPMSESRHRNLHKDMNDFLYKQRDELGNHMRPQRGNSGPEIQKKFNTQVRINALKNFYDSHPIKYWDARYDFYKNTGMIWRPW